jgi:hypothetical protein
MDIFFFLLIIARNDINAKEILQAHIEMWQKSKGTEIAAKYPRHPEPNQLRDEKGFVKNRKVQTAPDFARSITTRGSVGPCIADEGAGKRVHS